MERHLRTHLIAATLLLCWFVFFCLSPTVSFYSRGILQYFAGGFSEFKPLFGILWLFICCVGLLIPAPVSRITSLRLTILSLGGAYALTVVGHLLFIHRFHLSALAYVVTASEREISSNQLLHIHVMKGSLYLVLKALGLDSLQVSADPGRFFAETLPAPLFIVHLLLVVSAGFGIVWSLRRQYEQWRLVQRSYLVVPYAISSSAALRCAVDGGPLDWTTASLSPVFLMLLWATPVPAPRHYFVTAGSIVVNVGSIMLLHSNAGSPAPALVGLNSALGVLFLAVATLWAAACAQGSLASRPIAGAIASTVLLGVLSQNTFWAWDARAWWRTIPAGSELLLVDYHGEWDFPVRSQEGTLAIRTIRVDSEVLGGSMYNRLGIRHNFPQVNPLNVNCDAHNSYERHGRVLIVEGAEIRPTFSRPILEDFELTPCKPKEPCSYRYRASIPGCIPDITGELVVNRLFEAGATKVILIPDSGGHSADEYSGN